MPRFLARIVYALRGKRRVRLHLVDDGPTLDGVLVGRWSGHYVLLLPRLVKGPEESVELDGLVEVPAERVVFVQVVS